MNDYATLPKKVKTVVDTLTAKGLGALYAVNVGHFDSCRSHTGGSCDCGTSVQLQETIPDISRLPEDMQREVAAFLRSGATGHFTVDVRHTGDCGTHGGDECNCVPALSIKGDAAQAADVVVDALTALTSAVNKQTISAIDMAPPYVSRPIPWRLCWSEAGR